jgi:hypothetical protein
LNGGSAIAPPVTDFSCSLSKSGSGSLFDLPETRHRDDG